MAVILSGIVTQSSANNPLRSALRQATAAVHERVEQGALLLAPDLTPAAYRNVLQAYYGFYAPLEARLAPVAATVEGLGWSQRVKLPWLEADLCALGCTRLEALPRYTGLPPVERPEQALGALYVLEGASLGGQVLCRRLSRHPELVGGLRFLRGYGDATGRRWREFLGCLRSQERQPVRVQERLISSAVDTFQGFARWLEQQECLK